MWLDCILLFPVIMQGLERLVKEKKGILYCISLGVSILSNYYISIMICMFMVIYYFCLLILEGRKSFRDFFVSALQFGIRCWPAVWRELCFCRRLQLFRVPPREILIFRRL